MENFMYFLTIATSITGVIWLLYKLRSIVPLFKKNIFEQIGSFFPILLVILIVRSYVIEPYYIVSSSMFPALHVGDFVAISKFHYGIRNPINNNPIIKGQEIKRGDIVVFKNPQNTKQFFIKRVIGLPGDVVSFNAQTGELKVQADCDGNNCKKSVVKSDLLHPSPWIEVFTKKENSIEHHFEKVPLDTQDATQKHKERLMERKETIDSVTYDVLIAPFLKERTDKYFKQPTQPIGRWHIPKGHYFMMGDNRSNSSDSRYWGFVPDKYIVGKAIVIWFSVDGSFPLYVPRLNRIGPIN